MPKPPQTDPFHDRYSRQVLFAGIGLDGQHALAEARIAIIGVGATGAATAALLARAGVGHITLIDRDFVEPSNLQRQILFDESDALASLPKAEAARRKIAAFNSAVEVDAVITDLVPANMTHLLAPASLLLDCTDNFETRYLLNDYSVREGKPWIYAAAVGSYAAGMAILPRSLPPSFFLDSNSRRRSPLSASDIFSSPTGCLACLFPAAPSGAVETCDIAGILSTAVNLAASIQVTEALKILTGQQHLVRRTLFSFDLWAGTHSEVSNATPDPACAVCYGRQFIHLNGVGRPHITLCGRNSVQIHEHRCPLDLHAMHARLLGHADLEELRSNSMLLRFRRGPHTITLFPDGRALIQGTTDPAVARSLYARFVGS